MRKICYCKKNDPLGESSIGQWKKTPISPLPAKSQNLHWKGIDSVERVPHWNMSLCTGHFAAKMMKHAILLWFFFTLCKNLPSWKCVFSSKPVEIQNLCDFAFPGLLEFRMLNPELFASILSREKTTHGYQPIGLSRQVSPHISNKCKRSQNWPCKSPTTCLRRHGKRVKNMSSLLLLRFLFQPKKLLLSSIPCVFTGSD